MTKERSYYLDIVRILACLMVVVMHSPMPTSGFANAVFLTGLSYFTSPCIGLFFMTSGALLLPSRLSAKPFLRHRLNKILWPTLCWTFIYILLNVMRIGESDISSAYELLRTVFSVPFSAQGTGVLWFMYTLIGLYLLTPVLSRWLDQATPREELFYIILGSVTFVYPYLGAIVHINESSSGMLYYFSGYVCYFVLGHYLSRVLAARSLIISSGIVGLLGAVALVGLKITGCDFDFYTWFWYLTLPVEAMSVCWFLSIRRFAGFFDALGHRLKDVVSKLSGLSFGVYLCHIAFMRSIFWKIDAISGISCYVLQTAVIFILSAMSSFLFCYLVARTPLGKYLIGYRIKV